MKEVGSYWGELVALVFLVPCLLERGKLDEAAELVDSAGMDGELPPAFIFSGVAWSRGLVRAAQGRNADALADFLDCGRREQAWREVNPAVVPWRSHAALAHAQLGQHAEARRLACEELELARRYGAPRAIGIALRALGLVEEAAGNPDEGLEHLSEAVAVLERSEARLEHARALTDLGAALRRTGHRVRGREPLRRGLDLADRCGATVLVRSARTELLVAGGRPRRRRLSGAEALTPSERRIAEMAAGGCSNRKIAQDLFVTVKTVEGHLGRAYGKLGIGSRVELKRALGEEAKAPPT